MSDVEALLAHHGVKGMKWGVHRSRGSGSAGTRTAQTHPPHPDAIRAKAFKSKIKSGSTDALSTEELRDLVNRLNLEKQYKTLHAPTGVEKGKKVLAETLLSVGKQQASRVVNDQAAKFIAKKLASR